MDIKKNRIERLRKVLFQLLIGANVIWFSIAFACLWLMTLGTDEAWVLNGLRSTLFPYVENLSSNLIATSGGFFAIGNLAIEYFCGSIIWAHRLFSLVCFLSLLIIFILSQTVKYGPANRLTLGLLIIAPVLSITGTAEVSTMALGASSAVFLVFLACILWSQHDTIGMNRAILCACLCGLGAASRFEMILVVLAFPLLGMIKRQKIGWRWLLLTKAEIVFVVTTVTIFIVNLVVMAQLGNFEHLAGATGTDSLLRFMDYPRQLNKVLVGQSFIPFAILVFITLLPFLSNSNEIKLQSSSGRFIVLSLLIAWILGIGWFFQAPIPHLRYLWPSLIFFSLPVGIVLKNFYETSATHNFTLKKIGSLLIATALVLGGATGSFRSIVMGEQDYISWEWSREISADYFRRFQHLQDQKAATKFINQLPDDAVILCYIQPYVFRYMSKRPVMVLNDYLNQQEKPSGPLFLILSPGIGLYQHLPPKSYLWIEDNCQLSAQFGRYSIYQIPADLLSSAPNQLKVLHREYNRHPMSDVWFGRTGWKK